MKNYLYQKLFLILALVALPISLKGIDTKDTMLLTQPAISKTHIAFVYANDLWVANVDGKGVRRLTADQGVESNPAFSPNGKLIAVSAQYEGNTDVYVVPVEGGVPKRLSWHPAPDIVRGFTHDGSAVFFISTRYVFQTSWPYFQLFTVPIDHGFPEFLNIPHSYKATYSPDGTRMATRPVGETMLWASSAKMAYVLMSPLPVSGKRAEWRT